MKCLECPFLQEREHHANEYWGGPWTGYHCLLEDSEISIASKYDGGDHVSFHDKIGYTGDCFCQDKLKERLLELLEKVS